MKERIPALDLARGFTVLFMPMVHCAMLYLRPSEYGRLSFLILRFIAEGPGAQLFMLIMGMVIALSKAKTIRQIMKRGWQLWMAGYLLNFLRLVLPAQTGILPREAWQHLVVFKELPAWLNLLLTGDILQFAGIAFILCSLLHRSVHHYRLLKFTFLFITAAIISPLLWALHTNRVWLDVPLSLLLADGFAAFFPVFPWICYPIAGLACGDLFRMKPGKLATFYLFIAGIMMMLAGLGWNKVTQNPGPDFYRTTLPLTLSHTGFVLCWLALAHFVSKYIKDNPVASLLSFCSRRITPVYFLQWMVISLVCGFTGYQQSGTPMTLITGVLISVSVFGTCYWLFDRKPWAIPPMFTKNINDGKSI